MEFVDIKISAEQRAIIESVLKDGETVETFIVKALDAQLTWREAVQKGVPTEQGGEASTDRSAAWSARHAGR